MEYGDVMKEFNRMCWFYRSKNKCPMGCPMAGCNISQCRKFAFQCPAEFASTVMQWAAEHPVPKYPSWGEYLCNIGLIHDCTESEDVVSRLFDNVIPDCIAQKLGLKAKEG